MKKIVLTENQFKKLLSHETRKTAYTPLRQNIFSTNIFKQELDEGYYKTYDIDFVVRHFCGYLNFSNDWNAFATDPDRYNGFITKVDTENNEEYIELVSVDDPVFLKRADDAMELCGFYKAYCEEYCEGYVQVGYEKHHDKEIVLNTNKLYHVTSRDILPKIKREGLVPKARDKQTHHLERIYFFKRDYGEEGFKMIAEDLYKNKTTFGYMVVEVDLEKLNDKVVFHNDPNTKDGIYTTDNIPPGALKIKYQYKV